MENDFIKAFMPHSLDEADLSEWDFNTSYRDFTSPHSLNDIDLSGWDFAPEDYTSPCSLNDIDLSGWDLSAPDPEAERLIREVLIDKAVNGTQCQSEYAMEILKSMKV